VLVHDPDVNLEELLGSNREYLERQLPQIGRIMRSRIEDALEGCQVVVVSQKRPEFVPALQAVKGRARILDLVRLASDPADWETTEEDEVSWENDLVTAGSS
jgi:GDP-mannose 6-dehydrogenase